MHLILNKRRIKNLAFEIVLLLPFFELMMFELLSRNGYMEPTVNLIMRFFSLCRLLITFYYLIIKKHYKSYTVIGFTLFILSENLVSIINGSIYINYFIGSFTTIGLCLLCASFIHKSYEDYIDGCTILFGILSIVNALQCYIMPGGFFNADYKAKAIYILGSKNTCFFFYIVFLYFLLYKQALRRKQFGLKTFFIMLFLLGATYVSDAMSAFVLLALLILYYCITGFGKRIYKIFNIKYLLIVIVIVALFILVPRLRTVFNPILSLIGRDATVTGRDVLWLQALTKFQTSPLIGNGIHTEYVLGTGVVADHAHSHYLDVLAKYGVITFTIFILTIVFVIKKAASKKKGAAQIIALDCVVLGLLLLHSIIDHLELFNYIVILISVELLPAVNSPFMISKHAHITSQGSARLKVRRDLYKPYRRIFYFVSG